MSSCEEELRYFLVHRYRGMAPFFDIGMVVFGSIALFLLHVPAGRHSDSTPDSRRVRLGSR